MGAKHNTKFTSQGADPDSHGSELKRSLDGQLNDFLINYDARLIEIDQKYPLGDKERVEWLIAHRKNGLKRIKEICEVKA
jgi:hypothetical protein